MLTHFLRKYNLRFYIFMFKLVHAHVIRITHNNVVTYPMTQ